MIWTVVALAFQFSIAFVGDRLAACPFPPLEMVGTAYG